MQCSLNTELLTLAVHLARRDVARMRSPADLASDQQSSLIGLSNNLHSATTRPCEPLSGQRHLQPSTTAAVKCAASETSIMRSRKTGAPVHQARSVEIEPHIDSVNSLPIRSLSPPTRDTDRWVPNRTKALHEPTEKQLQSARDSHMRQLQAKIARYSAAMAELRLQAKSQPVEKDTVVRNVGGSGTGNCAKGRPLQPRGRALIRGRSYAGRFRSGSKRGLRSALIRQEVIPLDQRSRVIRLTETPEAHQPGGNVSDSEISTDYSHSDELTRRMNEQVKTLWEQTVQALRSHSSDLVVLEPDDQFDLMPDLYSHSVRASTQPEGRNLPVTIPPSPPPAASTDTPQQNSDCSCPNPVCADSSTDLSSLGLNASGLLREIDQAEAEEAEIRRRWAHLSLKQTDSAAASHAVSRQHQNSGDRLHSSRQIFQPIVSPLTLQSDQTSTEHLLLPERSVMDRSANPNKNPRLLYPCIKLSNFVTNETSFGLISLCSCWSSVQSNIGHFRSCPTSGDPFIVTLENEPPQYSYPLKGARKTGSSGTDRIPLRLSTGLHRAILVNAHEAQLSRDKRQRENNLLTSPSAENLRLVRVCEWISDDLIDQILSDVADDLERQMSCLVDTLVDGELYSEDPDSLSLTGQASFCPSVANSIPNSGPESSTHVSGSLDSAERLPSLSSSHRTPENTLPSQELRSTESRQSHSSCAIPSKGESDSACANELSYTFQFDQISVNDPSTSQSSTSLSANLIVQPSETNRSNEVNNSGGAALIGS
ncbi:hypothetical protein FGIG_03402 [Fasciola gigantica]|uniref:Uncharacterized protein n=1 Tax=Fasciola gigantica TaxID=46835 RepID=A0A504YDG5_FASGI|nr:hypothetical protein FGIG_03402 [Fasciola gigantica]